MSTRGSQARAQSEAKKRGVQAKERGSSKARKSAEGHADRRAVDASSKPAIDAASRRAIDAASRRRDAVASALRARGGGVAVMFTSDELLRNGDAHHVFRPDSSFHYLSAFPEPEAAVVIVADRKRTESLLFCREKNEEREIWDGFRYGPEAARRHFGFDEAHPISALDQQMAELLVHRPALWYPLGRDAALDARVRGWLDAIRAKTRSGATPPAAAADLSQLVEEMRLFKDATEIETMQRAADISARAHRRAMQACRPGMREFEIEAELLHEFHRGGAQAPAYTSIVAGGANACVLHYISNRATLRDGDLLLIDAGCELDGYASDITRTFPVNGRFTGAQRAAYEIVLAAQKAAFDETRPGRRFNLAHEAAVRVLVDGMIELKLLKGSRDGLIESGAYKRFYMHRTGHWLGRDVHDCGAYVDMRKLVDARKLTDTQKAPPVPVMRKLEPGMVVTVEPGLYIRAADDIPAELHGIGIRIEDDLLVTAKGHRVLTSAAPKSIAEIEDLMREEPMREGPMRKEPMRAARGS